MEGPHKRRFGQTSMKGQNFETEEPQLNVTVLAFHDQSQQYWAETQDSQTRFPSRVKKPTDFLMTKCLPVFHRTSDDEDYVQNYESKSSKAADDGRAGGQGAGIPIFQELGGLPIDGIDTVSKKPINPRFVGALPIDIAQHKGSSTFGVANPTVATFVNTNAKVTFRYGDNVGYVWPREGESYTYNGKDRHAENIEPIVRVGDDDGPWPITMQPVIVTDVRQAIGKCVKGGGPRKMFSVLLFGT